VDGTTVYRVNEPGKMPAIWACEKHAGNIDPELKELVEIIEEGKPKNADL
jgi:hypothetical protein